MYNWLVFLHILFSFLFILAHGVHAAAMLKFRGEPDPERSLTFFNIVPDRKQLRILTVLLGILGFAAVAVANWWSQGWVWASAGVFVLISFVMFQYGAGYFGMMQDAARRLIEARKTNIELSTAMQAFEKARKAPHVMLVSLVGIGGLAAILWLMRFKPF